MYTVYALQSKNDGRIYVGFTTNLQRRLSEHNSCQVTSTKAYIPWTVIYTEDASTRVEARNREKQLKSGYGKEFLKTLNIRG